MKCISGSEHIVPSIFIIVEEQICRYYPLNVDHMGMGNCMYSKVIFRHSNVVTRTFNWYGISQMTITV